MAADIMLAQPIGLTAKLAHALVVAVEEFAQPSLFGRRARAISLVLGLEFLEVTEVALLGPIHRQERIPRGEGGCR